MFQKVESDPDTAVPVVIKSPERAGLGLHMAALMGTLLDTIFQMVLTTVLKLTILIKSTWGYLEKILWAQKIFSWPTPVASI